ncbi:MAG: type IV secretion system DotC family protein [Deltaproteobacteria bacterium]|nr:type IV secretion system DotC family protein [Deltaproteobacteria bacterium]
MGHDGLVGDLLSSSGGRFSHPLAAVFFRLVLVMLLAALGAWAFSGWAAANETPAPPKKSSDSGSSGARPPELRALMEARASDFEEAYDPKIPAVRTSAQREAALGASVQAGARWRYERILEEVAGPLSESLDFLFDFGPLVGERGGVFVVPPVATSAGPALKMETEKSALGQEKSYRLFSDARLAGVRPDWRHYLLRLPEGPGPVHGSLRPKGGSELSRWRGWVSEGWRLGVEQADRLFASNVATLTRDYVGMLTFKRLVVEDYARQSETSLTETALDVRAREMVFQKTLYRLVGQDGFVFPRGGGGRDGKTGR